MIWVIGLGIGQICSCPGEVSSPYSPLSTTPAGAKDMYSILEVKVLMGEEY